ncbi:MAG: hypothetical protein NTY20_04515 [Candidatus Aenigmarchaeota archaeon]|nr:hypothetical protein [Candidatus Aenigmarchaeota archaeon]
MHEKPIFGEHSEEAYLNLRTKELFDLYVSMLMQKRVHDKRFHPGDRDELEKVQGVLYNNTLPEKFYFYQSLGGWQKSLYKGFLILK